MERLTKRLDDGTAFYNHGGSPSNMVTDRMIIERLAAYEDTGLEPEEVTKLLKASGWISIKDRLPEISGWYAIYTELMIFCVLPYSARHRAFNSFDENEDTGNAFRLPECAYWTALPDLPTCAGSRKGRENE